MGHYDSCYEGTRIADAERHQIETDKEFMNLQSKLKTHEKDFLLKISRNINDWMVFVNFIKSLK